MKKIFSFIIGLWTAFACSSDFLETDFTFTNRK
jgi:hypothetical protein